MKIVMIFLMVMISSCVFKFEVPSGKTKLERQILGYKPLVSKEQLKKLVKRSKAPASDVTLEHLESLRDILKPQIILAMKKGTIGESKSGQLVVLSEEKWDIASDPLTKSRIHNLISDENSARGFLVKKKDLPLKSFSYYGVENSWYQRENGEWVKN
jgi:hypothetical protein